MDSKTLFLGVLHRILVMVKNYWEKRFKKELIEEEDKLKQEVAEAVRKKLAESAEEEPES
jgi:hypothetical protein